jgi:dTDP-4-dehydrorhamnose 3,5-epimerase
MDIHLTKGGIHQDNRGIVSFVNSFDLTPIKRFYQIKHQTTNIIRAWQGHQKESKWFYCVEGNFIINYAKPDSWINPSGLESVSSQILEATNPHVLHIPPQYVTGIKANLPNSILIVYSDFTLLESQTDDFRFDINTWSFKNI